MDFSIKILVGLLLNMSVINGVKAQVSTDSVARVETTVDITQLLPPLAELQELAIENSPILKILDTEVSIGKYKIIEEQRKWLGSFGVEGGAKYGLFDNLIISQDLGLEQSNTQTTEQTRYYFGAYMKIPISDIVDRSKVNAAKAEKDKLQFQRQASIQDLRKLIILAYNEVIKQHRGILIKAKLVESYRLQMMRAKLDFSNGEINISDYARLDQMWSKSNLELEEAKLDYKTAFQILEETVGIKIQLRH